MLFYPGAGSDWKQPVELFGPWIDTFLFVDKNLSRISADLSRSLLPFNIEVDQGQPRNRIVKSALKATFESGREVELSWVQEDALAAIRQLEEQIGVFFYRGDSSEGSDLWWLFHTDQQQVGRDSIDREDEEADREEDEDESDFVPHGLFHEVLRRLADRALIVTDGSKGDGDGTAHADDPNSYSRISAFRGRGDITPVEAMEQAESFTGPLGHTFECIGCINQRRRNDNGPVLIWQVCSP